MFESVLVANRGEIACRVIRTARRLGLRTIAVHSDADRDAPHVRMAHEAVAIGPAPASESYLRAERIVEAALATRASCVHPGYGFLSENAAFAEACEAAGIVFVGPPASAIRAMGLKDAAKSLVERAGVPVVPGYHGERQEPEFLRQKAYEVGYPVLIKAVAGGGGKGMRRVDRHADFEAALEGAQREARGAFGDPRVLVERYVTAPRHVEVQVFGDRHGHVVHLFERDCSLQRRHQKVIEEAPAPGMTAAVRAAMGAAAVNAAKAVGYVGAGTVEFIADGSGGLKPDGFFFMEMNTRLQVEHPVTEAITGLDLVELQLRVAFGEPLPFAQEDLRIDGHAVEARLYAEDPERGFLPSTGRLVALRLPEGAGVRVDSGVAEGGEVTAYYDPMIAKVIAHAPTRDEALDRLGAALARTLVAGPRTNLAFLRALCAAPGFREEAFDTGFIDRNAEALGAAPRAVDGSAVAAAAALIASGGYRQTNGPRFLSTDGGARWRRDPWATFDGFGNLPSAARRMELRVDSEPVGAEFVGDPQDAARLRIRVPDLGFEGPSNLDWEGSEDWRGMGDVIAGEPDSAVRHDATAGTYFVIRGGRQTVVTPADPLDVSFDAEAGDGAVKSPMHGKVVAVLVAPGDAVTRGQRLALVEAMKMEHALTSPRDGVVAEVGAEAGDQVAEGAILVVVRDAAADAA